MFVNNYSRFILDMIGKVILQQIRIRSYDFDHSFCKSFHVSFPNFRILTFKFLQYFEALCQLSEYIDDTV